MNGFNGPGMNDISVPKTLCVSCGKAIKDTLTSYTRITADGKAEFIHAECLAKELTSAAPKEQ